MMTVKEAIDKLSKLNPENNLVFTDEYGQGYEVNQIINDSNNIVTIIGTPGFSFVAVSHVD